MTYSELSKAICELRKLSAGINGAEIVICESGFRFLCDDLDDEFDLTSLSELRQLIKAIHTIKRFSS